MDFATFLIQLLNSVQYGLLLFMLAAGLTDGPLAQVAGTLAVALAAVNVFGGFLVTQRMLEMFRKKEPKAKQGAKE